MSFRSIKLTIITVLSILFLSSSLSGHSESSSEKEVEDDKKIVCQKYRPTGTRITKKTCMSKRGWKEVKRRAQDAARLGQRLSTHFNKSDPRSQH